MSVNSAEQALVALVRCGWLVRESKPRASPFTASVSHGKAGSYCGVQLGGYNTQSLQSALMKRMRWADIGLK